VPRPMAKDPVMWLAAAVRTLQKRVELLEMHANKFEIEGGDDEQVIDGSNKYKIEGGDNEQRSDDANKLEIEGGDDEQVIDDASKYKIKGGVNVQVVDDANKFDIEGGDNEQVIEDANKFEIEGGDNEQVFDDANKVELECGVNEQVIDVANKFEIEGGGNEQVIDDANKFETEGATADTHDQHAIDKYFPELDEPAVFYQMIPRKLEETFCLQCIGASALGQLHHDVVVAAKNKIGPKICRPHFQNISVVAVKVIETVWNTALEQDATLRFSGAVRDLLTQKNEGLCRRVDS